MKKHLLSLFIAMCTVAASQAAIPDMKFRRLDTRDGLSNSQINCIYRDSRGFVWLGTAYGLNRYDGYRFKTFYSNLRDTTTMRDNYTDKVMEAYDGKLWLKQGMAYCIYDPVTETFNRNINTVLDQFGISGGVEYLYIDGKKNFWVKLYEDGIYFYNPYKKLLKKFKLGYGKQEFNASYAISSIADFGNNVVVATHNGELVSLNGEKGWISWDNKWMRQNGGLENQDYNINIDRQGNFWVSTEQFTFVYMQREKRWFKNVPEFLRAHGITEGVPEKMMVWDVKTDRHGWIWIATDHDGLFVVDLKNRQMRQYLNSKFDESTISDNTPKHLYMDSRGQVWIGTYKNGVNQYIEGSTNIRSLELGDINTVSEDRHGNYWLGTNDRGIIVYDPRTGEQTQYTVQNSNLSSNIMVGSYTASDGTIWFGSYNGGLVHCLPSATNPREAAIVNYRTTEDGRGLANNNVWGVTEDRWHRIWLSTLGGGLQMLNPKTGQFRTWDTKNTNFPSDYMTTVNWIKKGWLMVGTSYYYAFVNPKTGKVANRLLPESPNITVNTSNTVCVMEDSRGIIWQGSSSGVVAYDQKRGFITLIDMTKGLYGSSVTSIIEDKDHTMWVVTDHGVSKIIPELQDNNTWQFIIRSYNTRDGLQQGTYNQRSTCLTHNGLILIGGQAGLDIINPKGLSSQHSNERPIFSGLQIFDADIAVGQKVGGRVVLKQALDECRDITLRFNDQFTIQLGSDAGKVNNRKRFVYRLEGFNDNWVKTSELNPNITYNSLRAGSYVLYVRMLNDDGTMGTEEIKMIITIKPPLWRTRWMILLYMLLIGAVAWWWRRRFLQRQAQKMEAETLRREQEKRQWMNEMRQQIAMQQAAPEEQTAPQVEQIELHKQHHDIISFMEQLAENYVAPDEKRVKLHFISPLKEQNVDFDAEQLHRAIHILLDNSVKFSPGDCRITIGVARTDKSETQIQVADNGIGIRDEYKVHAFDRMPGAEGIGLDRVKDIIDIHGGSIRLEDNPGGGTVFIITLPPDDDAEIEEAVMMDDE